MTELKMEMQKGKNVEREGKGKTALEYMVKDIAGDAYDFMNKVESVSKKAVVGAAKGVGYLASAPIVGMLPEKRKMQIYGGKKGLVEGAQWASIVASPVLECWAMYEAGGGEYIKSNPNPSFLELAAGFLITSLPIIYSGFRGEKSIKEYEYDKSGELVDMIYIREHIGSIEGEILDRVYSPVEKYFASKWRDAKRKVDKDVEDVVKGGDLK